VAEWSEQIGLRRDRGALRGSRRLQQSNSRAYFAPIFPENLPIFPPHLQMVKKASHCECVFIQISV
jgi:hypothetical protein